MENDKLIIEKLKELNKRRIYAGDRNISQHSSYLEKIESEISDLESARDSEGESAEEFFEQISPNDNIGVREKLKRAGLFHIVCSVMERFADQSKQKEPEKPRELTDEEIYEWAVDAQFDDGLKDCTSILIYGAKWYRDQLSPKASKCSNCGKAHEYSDDICYVKIGSKT